MRAITTHQYLWETVPLLFLLALVFLLCFNFQLPLPAFYSTNQPRSLSNLRLLFLCVQVLRLEAYRAPEERGHRHQPTRRARRRYGPEAKELTGKAVITVCWIEASRRQDHWHIDTMRQRALAVLGFHDLPQYIMRLEIPEIAFHFLLGRPDIPWTNKTLFFCMGAVPQRIPRRGFGRRRAPARHRYYM